ncbi:ABC-three component system protein [Oceanobacillus sp. CF4.6]|uniref:ABC-three component system protein n=1 Tax=Oceanobacillus sp. CF4.6 TaxID=3373080 RepID=UPI003EE5AE55
MRNEKNVHEKTAAESKSIGFDYQYYFFLYELLQIKEGQSVGYEVKDDVHIEMRDGKQTLIQLKHSINSQSTLSEKDGDLWKTISNWIEMITDSASNRSVPSSQYKFIDNTHFLLVTNKAYSKKNEFLSKISLLKENIISVDSLKEYLIKLGTPKEGKGESQVDKYIRNLYSMDDEWVEKFIKKLDFCLSKDELFELINTRLKEKNIPERRIEHVFHAVDSSLRKMIYEEVKARRKVTINFDEYYKKFTHYFDLGRIKKLPISLYRPKDPVPDSSETFTSIRQLIDSEILDKRDEDYEDELVSIFTSKMMLLNNIEQWVQDSEITVEEKMRFNDNSKKMWETIHKKYHSKLKRKLRKVNIEDLDMEEILESASQCYYDVLGLNLTIDETELDPILSNGQFYVLSDEPSIGWLIDWKERYKENE